MGTSIDAYALATEQLAAKNNALGILEDVSIPTQQQTPSEYADMTKYIQKSSEPSFDNEEIWLKENPYSQIYDGKNYIGQCGWFAWGRMKELYGFDPGFSGKGGQCVAQLLASHPDKFYASTTPTDGALFSAVPFTGEPGHTGIILLVDGNMVTYQDGNIDGWTNSFEIAKGDWQTKTVTLEEFKQEMGSMVHFANPYDHVEINW